MTSTFGSHQHQLAEDHAALLAARDHLDRLAHLVAGEQQASEGAADQCREVLAIARAAARVAGDPVGEVGIAAEILGVILCIISGACLLRPFDAAALGLQFAHQQLQQGRLADTVFRR
jgi:hypothetical protein